MVKSYSPTSEAVSKGIVKGLKPYKKDFKKQIEKVTTKEEQKKIFGNKKDKKKTNKKKTNKGKDLLKKLNKRLAYKKGKMNRVQLTIKQPEVQNIWEDPNRFFKNEWEDAKSMFFS